MENVKNIETVVAEHLLHGRQGHRGDVMQVLCYNSLDILYIFHSSRLA